MVMVMPRVRVLLVRLQLGMESFWELCVHRDLKPVPISACCVIKIMILTIPGSEVFVG
jgi:hypothetical protein